MIWSCNCNEIFAIKGKFYENSYTLQKKILHAACVGFALRQPGSIVASLEVVGAYVVVVATS